MALPGVSKCLRGCWPQADVRMTRPGCGDCRTSLRETSGGALTATIGWIRDRYLAPVASSMGEGFAAARNEGRRMSVDEAAALIVT